jgi:hypothetical protein
MGYKHLGPAFMDQLICAINGVYIAYIPNNFANFLVDASKTAPLQALVLRALRSPVN